jgi:hypothetical protein
MSNSIQAAGELLTASVETRTLTYRLLPFGEAGSTNVGKVIASKGSVTIPSDINTLELNEEHQFQKQIGKFVRVQEFDTHIEATVRIVETSAGNDALVLASEGLRTGISVEIAEPVIRDGHLIAGRLTGAGLVVRPAFSNARLTASDMGDITPEKETSMETTPSVEAAEVVSAPVQAAPIFAASSNFDLGSATFEAHNAGTMSNLNAALADLKTTSDAGKAYIADQEVGELWTARLTQRPLINTIGVKPLNSLYVTGTKKQRTFAVATWAGDKVELPTATFTTSRESWQATRKAVAVDIAAELIEFGGAGVIAELYEEAMDSYIVQSEAELLTYLIAQATSVSTTTTSAIAVIDKASEVLGAIGANMDFIAVAPGVLASLRSVTSANAPWWLASQGNVNLQDRSINLGGVTLVSNASLAAGTILIGDKRAVDYRESRDIKFQALDLPRGGIDVSFIKLKAQKVTDTGALLKFTGVTGA